MKTYTKTINEMTMKAYNDSGCDWVISSGGKTYRYSQKMTLKRAFELHESLYNKGCPFFGL